MMESEFDLAPKENFIKVTITKKGFDIPLTITKPPLRNRLETDRYKSALSSHKGPKVNTFDAKFKAMVPPLKFVNISTYNFSQTPTPDKDQKLAYFSSTFDTPKPTSRNLSTDNRESLKSATRKAIEFGPGSKIGSQTKGFTEKLTMKDLNVNLPSIIRSKKMKTRIRYKPNFHEFLYKG